LGEGYEQSALGEGAITPLAEPRGGKGLLDRKKRGRGRNRNRGKTTSSENVPKVEKTSIQFEGKRGLSGKEGRGEPSIRCRKR